MDEFDMSTVQLPLLFFVTRIVRVELIYMRYSGPIELLLHLAQVVNCCYSHWPRCRGF